MHFSRIWAFHCPVLVVEKKKERRSTRQRGCKYVYMIYLL